MKTWKIFDVGNIQLQETELSAENLVKIKVTKVPFLGTDLNAFYGKNKVMPITPGRLAVGLVSEADPLTGLQKGEKVVVSPYLKAPKGKGVLVYGVDVDGFLSDYIAQPFENVYSLPDGVSEDAALFAENIALANKTFSILHIDSHEYVVVLGANAQGLILAQLANYYHAIPILIDKDENKLDLARDYGICYCVNSEVQDVKQRVLEITGGNMADYAVFEAKGGLDPSLAINLTKNEGSVAIIGLTKQGDPLNADIRTILTKELTVVGIGDGHEEFPAAINLLANKAIDVGGLVDDRIPLEDCVEFFEKLTPNYLDNKMRILFESH
ncbi:MAG: zinc-binding dehydrogenase [Clostridia bacterium]|nr:zinc-binding dehydrogenase [Clostridia bacterium]